MGQARGVLVHANVEQMVAHSCKQCLGERNAVTIIVSQRGVEEVAIPALSLLLVLQPCLSKDYGKSRMLLP